MHLYVLTKGKRIAVQGSDKKVKDAVMLNPNKKSLNFGIYGSNLISEIRQIMPKWKCDERFKIKGDYFEEENALVFDMNNSEIFTGGTNNHENKK